MQPDHSLLQRDNQVQLQCFPQHPLNHLLTRHTPVLHTLFIAGQRSSLQAWHIPYLIIELWGRGYRTVQCSAAIQPLNNTLTRLQIDPRAPWCARASTAGCPISRNAANARLPVWPSHLVAIPRAISFRMGWDTVLRAPHLRADLLWMHIRRCIALSRSSMSLALQQENPLSM